MKIINDTIFCLLLTALLTSCTQKPEDVINEIYSSAYDGDFSKVAQYVLPDSVDELTDEEQLNFKRLAHKNMRDLSNASYEIEKVEEKGDKVKFVVKTSCNNISYKEQGFLLKNSEGKWHLVIYPEDIGTEAAFYFAGKFNEAETLLTNIRFAFDLVMADRNIPRFQYEAGFYYYYGALVKQDYVRYFELVRKSAEGGYLQGIVATSRAYYNGVGVAKDKKKAFELSLKAANLGHARSMTNVGEDYHWGYGVSIDYAKAKEWYEKALSLNDGRAASHMAFLYYDGTGVPKDLKKGHELTMKAIELYYMAGDTSWDASQTLYNAGLDFEKGEGVDADLKKAFDYYIKSAEMGYTDAMISVVEYYINGNAGEVNFDKALTWVDKAIAKGSSKAMRFKAYYFAGVIPGYEVDEAKYMYWINKSKQQELIESNSPQMR